MESINADAKTTLMVMGVNRVNHDSMCTRGLEYLTPEASVQRKLIRANAKNAVFKEQNSQLADKVMCNRDKIAEVYYMKTHRSQLVARLMARVDRKVVQINQQQDDGNMFFSTKKVSSGEDERVQGDIIFPRRRRLLSSRAVFKEIIII
jgi:hypothetical protein